MHHRQVTIEEQTRIRPMTRGDHYRMAREALANTQYTEAHAWATAGQLLPELWPADDPSAVVVGFLTDVDVAAVRAEVLEQIDVDPIEATIQALARLAGGVTP